MARALLEKKELREPLVPVPLPQVVREVTPPQSRDYFHGVQRETPCKIQRIIPLQIIMKIHFMPRWARNGAVLTSSRTLIVCGRDPVLSLLGLQQDNHLLVIVFDRAP